MFIQTQAFNIPIPFEVGQVSTYRLVLFGFRKERLVIPFEVGQVSTSMVSKGLFRPEGRNAF
ncbi:MAG TPA: hypothetical protein DEQ05_00670 [Thermodesulfobacterium commune]|nr:hypothetical protein [Thermodesulfobacterium commune]